MDFVQYDGRSGERYYVETTGSGCGLFDLDDDCDLDMYLLTGAPTPGAPIPNATPRNRLYFGLGGQPGPVELRVYWPDGSEQTEVIDEVDRYVTITQE